MNERIKVSILDDVKSYRQVIKKILSQDKRIIVHSDYSTGSDFIQGLSSPFKPDVCLLDIKLSGDITGIDCAKKVKEINPNIDIIFLTAYPDSQTLLQAKELEADYIEKGTIGEVLIDKIVTSMKRKEQLISLHYGIEKQYRDTFISFLPMLEETQRKVSTLTDIQRKVMKLRQTGKTIEEVANHLKMQPTTVGTHLTRALKKLALPDPIQYIDFDYTDPNRKNKSRKKLSKISI